MPLNERPAARAAAGSTTRPPGMTAVNRPAAAGGNMRRMPPETTRPTLPPADTAPRPVDSARLFLALWPPVALARELRGWCLAAAGPSAARCVPMARLHLTLHFLGSVPRSCLPALRVALRVPFSPFELRLGGCTRWPHGLLVAEPASVPPALAALHADLSLALAAAGLRSNGLAFRPHVTLARRQTAQSAAVSTQAAPLRWTVQGYVLCESLPGRYRQLQRYGPDGAATATRGSLTKVGGNAR